MEESVGVNVIPISIEHLLIGPFDLVLETSIAEACDSDVSQTSLSWETESCEVLH